MQIFLDQWLDRTKIKILVVHDWCLHKICGCDHRTQQRGQNSFTGNFRTLVCKFGLPAQIHTDGDKEFCKKLSDQLYLHLNIKQTTTSPAHPKLLKSISNPTFSLTLWIGNNLFQHSTFPTTPATTPPLRQLPLSYCLGLNWDYRHFQILTLNVYTMEKISHLNA